MLARVTAGVPLTVWGVLFLDLSSVRPNPGAANDRLEDR